jgi:hypothetical protein
MSRVWIFISLFLLGGLAVACGNQTGSTPEVTAVSQAPPTAAASGPDRVMSYGCLPEGGILQVRLLFLPGISYSDVSTGEDIIGVDLFGCFTEPLRVNNMRHFLRQFVSIDLMVGSMFTGGLTSADKLTTSVSAYLIPFIDPYLSGSVLIINDTVTLEKFRVVPIHKFVRIARQTP